VRQPVDIGLLKAVLIAGITYFCVLTSVHAAAAEALMERARENILGGKFEAAEQYLLSILQSDPENREALLLLGISLGRRGRLKEASSRLKHALYLDPGDPAANLELGRNFLERGVPAEAADYLERAIELSGGDDPALEAEAAGYLKEIKSSEKGEEGLTLSALAGLQYDTNVRALSEDAALPSEGKREDQRTIFRVKAGYADTGPVEAAASYSFYRSVHSHLGQYDTDLHSAGLRAVIMHGSAATELRYLYEYASVDGYRYLTSHSISPSIVLPAGRWGTAILTYRYKDTAAHDVPVSPANSGRTGHGHLLGISAAARNIPGGMKARAGYMYDDTGAALGEYAYTGQRVFIKAGYRFPENTGASLYAEYHERDFAGSGRGERRRTASASVMRDFGDRISLSLSYSHISNESADRRYEYERAVTGLLLKARY
jgi:tetratricopeptide (TPR) repeat protein